MRAPLSSHYHRKSNLGKSLLVHVREEWQQLCSGGLEITLSERCAALMNEGYTQARNKDYLFYKPLRHCSYGRTYTGAFFADMRLTDVAIELGTSLPLFYVHFDGDPPKWLANRIMIQEAERLLAKGLPLTLYLDWVAIPPAALASCWDWLEDGYCKHCGSDVSAEQYLCADCLRRELERWADELPRCEIPWCGIRIAAAPIVDIHADDENGVSYSHINLGLAEVIEKCEEFGLPEVRGALEHHTYYKKNVTMWVCTSCHGVINAKKDERYKPFWPRDTRAARRTHRLVRCSQCGGSALVPIDFPVPNPKVRAETSSNVTQLTLDGNESSPPAEPVLCSRCKERNRRKEQARRRREAGQRCIACGKKIPYNPHRRLCPQCYSTMDRSGPEMDF